ncbi:chloramphenicol resistance permease RarD [Alphaproteobacteria bacterium]|nr:chloramphenicol resistance permease RarD [Alphaproteobacteria bacterium]
MKNWTENRKGVAAVFVTTILWGLFPIYFDALSDESSLKILAYRIVWALPFVAAAIIALGRAPSLLAAFLDRKKMLCLAASALCIGTNWGVYIWAVTNHQTLDVSLGYFISPLFTLALGAVFLKERLNLRQNAAVLLAAAGVLVLALARGGLPWVAVALPVSFGFYSLIRKLVDVDALTGFVIESLLLVPFVAPFLFDVQDNGAIPAASASRQIMMILAGPMTAIPIMMFAYGARRIKLSTLGLMQYINPGLQLCVAILILGETLTIARAISCALVWCGLLLYSVPKHKNRQSGSP